MAFNPGHSPASPLSREAVAAFVMSLNDEDVSPDDPLFCGLHDSESEEEEDEEE
jgi:hypothetical protein